MISHVSSLKGVMSGALLLIAVVFLAVRRGRKKTEEEETPLHIGS